MTPQIVLYSPRAMPFTEKVGRGLRVKKLPFELVEPRSPEDYRRLSPETGLLPVLEVDGARIPDSAAILDYLDERFPDPPLLSPDPRAAREQRRLERWIDETFRFYILRWVQRRVGATAPLKAPHEGFPLGPMAQLGMIRSDGTLSPEWFDTSDGGPGPEFVRRLDDLAHMLGARPFFYADHLSRADLSVCGSLSAMYRDLYPGARGLLEERKTLFDHVERVLAATGGAEPV
ncbi:MAG TPA: glutathione S-transferase [Myxococcota bacterium]|nr:glutathione S-transferase [Myxococcota bacterium]